jgi:hypothetical protein
MNGNAAVVIGACITGEQWMAKDTGQKRPAREAVAHLAHHLYEIRGRQDGHHVDDWLRAEALLARTTVVVREAGGNITDTLANGVSQ